MTQYLFLFLKIIKKENLCILSSGCELATDNTNCDSECASLIHIHESIL